MTLNGALDRSCKAYTGWLIDKNDITGRLLNESNENLIKVYQQRYPNMQRYSYSSVICGILDKWTWYIFDGSLKMPISYVVSCSERDRRNIMALHHGIEFIWDKNCG